MEFKTCPKCGHHWIPRTDNPVQCPRCHCYIAIRKETEAKPAAGE